MNEVPPIMSDRDCLVAWRRARQIDALLVLGQRYGAFVYGASLRRAGDNAVRAAEITCAVFLVLARRGRRLSSKTVLAPWLFGMTALAAKKSQPSRWWPWRWRKRRDHAPASADANAWTRLAPAFDSACLAFFAPGIGSTLGCRASQFNATCAGVFPPCAAPTCSSARITGWRRSNAAPRYSGRKPRSPGGGVPGLYLPVKSPCASGL